MKFLGPVLAGCILAGAGAAQAAVVHHFDGWGAARLPFYFEDSPVRFPGYAGDYKRVDITIRFSDWDIIYGIENTGDASVTLPVIARMSVDMAGPGIQERIGASRTFNVRVPAGSHDKSHFSAEWSFAKHYSIIDPTDLALYSSSFDFWGEGSFSVWGSRGDAQVHGIAPLFFTVSVDYLPEVPVPAPALLLLSGLGGAAAFARRRRR